MENLDKLINELKYPANETLLIEFLKQSGFKCITGTLWNHEKYGAIDTVSIKTFKDLTNVIFYNGYRQSGNTDTKSLKNFMIVRDSVIPAIYVTPGENKHLKCDCCGQWIEGFYETARVGVSIKAYDMEGAKKIANLLSGYIELLKGAKFTIIEL